MDLFLIGMANLMDMIEPTNILITLGHDIL